MGNLAITRGAVESGVKVVAGYPGTPATEILEGFVEYPDVHTEWANNEMVALEVALGASLANVRSLAVMKHNGTNVCTDVLMHLNFTGIAGGMVLISADDPGGLSSQNEEDSRILVHTYANLPVFDPASAVEAKEMIKDAYRLSEETKMCFVLRPVMRVCHSRAIIEFQDYDPAEAPEAHWEDDRDRYIMSAVEVRELWRNQTASGAPPLVESKIQGSRRNCSKPAPTTGWSRARATWDSSAAGWVTPISRRPPPGSIADLTS